MHSYLVYIIFVYKAVYIDKPIGQKGFTNCITYMEYSITYIIDTAYIIVILIKCIQKKKFEDIFGGVV